MEGEGSVSGEILEVESETRTADLGYSSWTAGSYSVERYYSTDAGEWTGTSGELGGATEAAGDAEEKYLILPIFTL